MATTSRKQKLFFLSKLTLLAGLTLPTILSSVISCSNKNSEPKPETPTINGGSTPPDSDVKPKPDPDGGVASPDPGPVEPETPKPTLPVVLPENTNFFKTVNINSSNLIQARIVRRGLERNINDQVYETDLTKAYNGQFKYPAWNYDYEKNGYGAQNINGQVVEGGYQVFWERTKFLNSKKLKAKYSDPEFILDEIKKQQLKKHPAASLLYEENVSDTTKTVDKFFSLPTNVLGLTALGLYVPAGEIATLQFTAATLEKMKQQKINNFSVVLNSSYWDNKFGRNSKDSGGISDRYPFLRTEFIVDLKQLIQNNGEFRFGSPFGGTISVRINSHLKSANSNSLYAVYDNFDFNVTGAVEMLSYLHTVTTEEDWKQQIQRVLNKEITAPAMAIDFPFGSTNIAATAPKQFAYQKVENIAYPFAIMEKWNNFLFVSELFSSRDMKDKIKKVDFQFCNDIWGNAGALGGQDILYAPIGWSKNAFLSGDGNWTITKNWGVFHEINHSFEQNAALFKKNSHGETNQITMVNLSLLSDAGRWRNLANPNSEFRNNRGWERLQNSFSTIKYISDNNYTSKNKNSEYELQNLLLYTLGTFNFLDYVRNDVFDNPNTASGWNGFQEIVQLSDTFKLNFWPALAKFSSWWSDRWPASEETATEDQKVEIRRLNNSYKAFDFVGNIFATGAFLYNEKTKEYDYTNDMQAPIDIPAGKPYIFDFEKGINSANPNFQWSQLNLQATTTKLGGTLSLAKDNQKKLIYTPPADSTTIGQVDEFIISITPDEFVGKPDNYVSEYMWKVKFRLVPNLPIVAVFNDPFPQDNNKQFGQRDYQYMKNSENEAFSSVSDPRFGLLYKQDQPGELNQWQRVKVGFNFIAPKDGNYQFQIKSFSWAFIVNSDQPEEFLWQTKNSDSHKNWTNTFSVSLNAGQMLPLEIYLTAQVNKTQLEFRTLVDDQIFDVFDHAVVPWVNKLTDEPSKFLGSKYQYKARNFEFNEFQTSLSSLNAARTHEKLSKVNADGSVNYTFVNPQYKDIDNRLAFPDNKTIEQWGSKNLKVNFQVNFNKTESIQTIIFHHRTDNWKEARPTSMIIRDQDNNIIYQGPYGAQFNDRTGPYSVLALDRLYDVQQLSFELTNEKFVKGNKSALILNAVEFSANHFFKPNKVISVQNPAIGIHGSNWQLINNDPDINLSAVNAISLKTEKADEYIEFEMFAEGFDLVGQKNSNASRFDLYINDAFVKTVDTFNTIRLDNQILASYDSAVKGGELMKIKIINKTDQPLFLNYFQTYGPKVFVQKVTQNTLN